jgi:N-acetylglucosamine-6-phosphate deacetylase
MVTLAPAAADPAQIARLVAGGITVSLGHADCSHAEAEAATAAGASCATHLFNAMSPLGHREPGLVGAVLAGSLRAGVIADGIHVAHPALRIALAARPRGLFLVTDCMAPFGTARDAFALNGRTILRRDGRLTLADGTLAGADTTLPAGLRCLVQGLGLSPERALAMVTSEPADAIGAPAGRLRPGRAADLVLLTPDWSIAAVWQGGEPVAGIG